MKVTGTAHVLLTIGDWEISLGTAGWQRGRWRQGSSRGWDLGPLMILHEPDTEVPA
jgi:hypothetical protein